MFWFATLRRGKRGSKTDGQLRPLVSTLPSQPWSQVFWNLPRLLIEGVIQTWEQQARSTYLYLVCLGSLANTVLSTDLLPLVTGSPLVGQQLEVWQEQCRRLKGVSHHGFAINPLYGPGQVILLSGSWFPHL